MIRLIVKPWKNAIKSRAYISQEETVPPALFASSVLPYLVGILGVSYVLASFLLRLIASPPRNSKVMIK